MNVIIYDFFSHMSLKCDSQTFFILDDTNVVFVKNHVILIIDVANICWSEMRENIL